MGSALLLFSVVSTLCNVGVLLMFGRWQRLAAPPPPAPDKELERPGRKRDARKQLCRGPPGSMLCEGGTCCNEVPPGGLGGGNWPTLHEILHPGCVQGGNGTSKSCHMHSLNTSSAMLHLLSDILRGITLFAVALLLKLHLVSDAERADAWCALFVAGLIFLGSGSLFTEVGREIARWRSSESAPI
mmetsp:Transcript_2195/g.4406  ORF Transcript_2195/g.4406 Transcript_2195/m.4406 type:complete len:186 (-) Transcript_2195:78-635(-)